MKERGAAKESELRAGEGYVTFDRIRKHNKSSEDPRSTEKHESCFSFVVSWSVSFSKERGACTYALRVAKASLS